MIGLLETYPTLKLAGAIAGSSLFSSLATLYISWLIGRKKSDIDLALAHQESYKKHVELLDRHIKTSEEENKKLKEDLEKVSKKVDTLIEDSKVKDGIIESQRVNNLRWENENEKLKIIIKEKDVIISRIANDEDVN